MKSNILLILLSLGVISNLYAQRETKEDPFESLLPVQKVSDKSSGKVVNITPPQVTIEGVLWDSSTPQAIIDGNVYKIGDTLKNVDAKIYKIEKNKVFLFYSGRLFEMGITKKEAE
jgi:type II secretory pathway component PulC